MSATAQAPPPNALLREPRGAALALLYDRAPELLIEGPAGTGKTLGVLTKLLFCCEKYAGIRCLIVRKTRESCTESVLVEWETGALPPGSYLIDGPDRAHRQRYTFANRSAIIIGGMDKASKVMSTQYDLIFAEEATELTADDWETLTTRNRNHKLPYQQLLASCNPSAPTHWLNQRANVGLMSRHRSQHTDNPRYWDGAAWTPEGADYVGGTLARLTGVRRARLFDGRWAAAEGMVYAHWEPGTHLIDRCAIPADWRRYRVIDFGYTNPFVCQWWAMDGDGRLYRYRELYRTQSLVSDHAADILRHSAGERYVATIADHDAEDRATLHAAGIPTVAAYKAVGVGIQAVQSRLAPAGDGRPRLFLLRDSLIGRDERLVAAKKPLCTEQEIDGYVWEKSADGRPVKEAPVKVDDHGCDALRYMCAFAEGLGRVVVGAY